MKQKIALKIIIALGLLLIGFSSFAAQIIYGLQNASHFKSGASNKWYIQIGSYRVKTNALKIRSTLEKKLNYPVLVKKNKGRFIILVGPLKSAFEVRTTARKLNQGSKTVHPLVKVRAEQSSQQSLIKKPSKRKPLTLNKDKDGFPLVSNKWYGGLGLGWMLPFDSKSSDFASSGMPGFPDDRYSGKNIKHSFQYALLAGYQWRRGLEWFPAYSLGLEYAYTPSLKRHGFIFVNDLADTRNFVYQYKITQQIAMVNLKVDLYQWHQLMPYISGGAGVVFNQARNYSDAPIPGATFMLRRYGFTSGWTTQFAGTAGAGLDYWINDYGQIGLGYEFGYYGKTKTGFGRGVLSSNRLENKIYSNTVVLQGTYFFDLF